MCLHQFYDLSGMGIFQHKFVEPYSFSINIRVFPNLLYRLVVALAKGCEVSEAFELSS